MVRKLNRFSETYTAIDDYNIFYIAISNVTFENAMEFCKQN